MEKTSVSLIHDALFKHVIYAHWAVQVEPRDVVALEEGKKKMKRRRIYGFERLELHTGQGQCIYSSHLHTRNAFEESLVITSVFT
jgi:hypothetical protein